MKFIKTYPSASATRPGAAVGTATRKYAIMLAMGLTASIASAVLAAVETPIGREGRVSNSFVTVEGEGVGVLDDGSISYDEGATGDIIVTARPGWRVNGQKSVTLNPARGSRQPLGATSDLHEDQEHIHFFPRSESDEHVPDSHMEVFAEANPASAITMYALPDTSTVVTVSANVYLMRSALHRKVAKYGKCWCGQARDPEIEYGLPYAVKPDRYEWTASGAGLSFHDSTWTGEMSKGLGQKIEFTVTGKRNACKACECSAEAEATIDVHELSIERPDYVGLDMTDAKRGEYIYKSATAKIDPAPAKAEYEWQKCGRCEFYGATDKADVTYRANDATGPSGSYLEEELVVRATARNNDGLSAEANCTTNFTVVKVDVALAGIPEDGDETALPGVVYAADADDGELTKFGLRSLMPVQVLCYPYDVPGDVNVAVSSGAKLYEITEYEDDKASEPEPSAAVPAKSSYPCDKIASVAFGIHGHSLPDFEYSELIAAGHPKSGAYDKARFKVVPPPPLEVSVRLDSPAEGGGWPYDPVWDDPEWKATVDGSLAKKCAEDVDVALVITSLSRDAAQVEGGVYEWGLVWDEEIISFQVDTSEGIHTNSWAMADVLETSEYLSKVVAVEKETGNPRKAKSNTGEIVRKPYYLSGAQEEMVLKNPHVVSREEYDTAMAELNRGVNVLTALSAVPLAFVPGPVWVNLALTSGGGLGLAELYSHAMTLPHWFQNGSKIYMTSWIVTRYDWDGSNYVILPGEVRLPNVGAEGMEKHSIFEMGYQEVVYLGDDGETPETVHSYHSREYEWTNDIRKYWDVSSDWKWEPIPTSGYGLSEPKIITK